MEEVETDLNLTTDGHKDENNPEPSQTKNVSDGNKENTNQRHKFVRLPLARVKAMMKKDPSCVIISQDAVFLVTKATEMFIEYLAKETGKQLGVGKRKTVMRKDIDCAVENCPQLCFLDGALE